MSGSARSLTSGSGDLAATLEALARYRELIAAAPTRVHAVATAGARQSTDVADLLARLGDALGHPIDLIDGATEGRLSFRGATAAIGSADLVIDIGGGSTELVTADGVWSMPVGAGSITRHDLTSDPPRPEELTNALGSVADHLDDALRALPELVKSAHAVGVAGTIVTAAAVDLGAFDPPRLDGYVLERAAVEDAFRALATERLADRIHNPGLPAARAEVIVGGLCVLLGIMRRLQLGEITVSLHGLLDGIIIDMGRA